MRKNGEEVKVEIFGRKSGFIVYEAFIDGRKSYSANFCGEQGPFCANPIDAQVRAKAIYFNRQKEY